MHLHEFLQLVIAQDGHSVPAPYQVDTLEVAPGLATRCWSMRTCPGCGVWHCHILSHAENSTGLFGMVTALVVQ